MRQTSLRICFYIFNLANIPQPVWKEERLKLERRASILLSLVEELEQNEKHNKL